MIPTPPTTPLAPTGTALALIEAATELFGRQGYAATSIRDVAALADTNLASISYHFGNKEGLRQACAFEFARKLGAALGAVEEPRTPTPDQARETMRRMLRAVVPILLGSSQAQAMVSFVLRELFEKGPTADLIYESFVEPAHRRFCDLWGQATGRSPEAPEVKLRIFSFLGQILYFRVATPFVTHRLGWDEMGPAEVATITDLLLENLTALLAADQEH